MSDLGQLLKKARNERKLTLDDLQESTKIRKRYLEAIEEGDFKVLPGNFYTRAFIKSYAEAVGLDPEEVLRLYRNVIPDHTPEPKPDTGRSRRRATANMDNVSKWMTSLLLFSFLLLIVIVIYSVAYNKDQPDEKITNPPITDEVAPNEGESDGTESVTDPLPDPEPEFEPEPEPEVAFVNQDGSNYIYSVSNVDQLEIELAFPNGDCYVVAREGDSNGTPIETQATNNMYQQADTDRIVSDGSVWIRFGKPSSAEIRVNGVLLEEEKLKESNPWNVQINLVKADNVPEA